MEEHEAGRLRAMKVVKDKVEDNGIIRLRIEFLHGLDKAIAVMYFEYGVSCRRIAVLTGINEVTVARRLDRIVRRLRRWGGMNAARERGRDPMEERIAREYLVCGRSQKAVAARLGCTRYAVQKALRAVRDMSGCTVIIRNRDIPDPAS